MNASRLQLLPQGRELCCVVAPLGYRSAIQAPPDLSGACSGRRRGIGMKVGACILPVESAEIEQSSYLLNRVGYQVLVLQLVDRSRQRLAPMAHEAVVGDVITSELLQVIGKRIP